VTFAVILKFNPNHDERGRFTGGALTLDGYGELDRKIVDYKPDRTLDDPKQVERIDTTLDNARFVPYSKAPFFDALNAKIGVDPAKGDIGKYLKARASFFKTLRVSKVPLDKLVVTQSVVNKERVKSFISGDQAQLDKPVQAVRYKGETWIMNGHHRVVAAVQKGLKKINARVVDLTTKEDADTAWGVCVKEPASTLLEILRYDPEQPRVPAGNSEGGQFAATGGAGGAVNLYGYDEERIINEWQGIATSPVNRTEAYSEFDTQHRAQLKALPTNLREAVIDYTDSSYGAMNKLLAGRKDWWEQDYPDGNSHYEKVVRQKIEALDEALEKTSLGKDVQLFRGAKIGSNRLFSSMEDALGSVGKVIKDPAFQSTSVNADSAKGFGEVLLVINAPKEAKGLFVKTVSLVSAEDEVVLPRNASYVVRKATKESVAVGDRKVPRVVMHVDLVQ
jgi:hypothetical protein